MSFMFTKVHEIREIFDKNPFILGTKLNVLNYVLMRVEKRSPVSLRKLFFFAASMLKLHREEPSSQEKLSLQKKCSLGSDSRKAVNRLIPDTSTYCSTFNSTFDLFNPETFYNVPKNKHFYFYSACQVESFMLYCFGCLSQADFCQFS